MSEYRTTHNICTNSVPIKSGAGFTLVELVVAIGITAFLASLVIVYGSTAREQTALVIEQAKLAQVIGRARSLAVATYNKPPAGGARLARCGVGVSFDYEAQSYALFRYNLQDRRDCLSIPSGGIDASNAAAYEVLEHYTLNPLSQFEEERAGEKGLSFVFFIPPDPTTVLFIDPAEPAGPSGKIFLVSRKGSSGLSVEVTNAGQLTFQ